MSIVSQLKHALISDFSYMTFKPMKLYFTFNIVYVDVGMISQVADLHIQKCPFLSSLCQFLVRYTAQYMIYMVSPIYGLNQA